jgi:hypothetical protein
MTAKIDSVEPNIFPDVEHLDARDAGRNVEVIFGVRIEGKPTPVNRKAERCPNGYASELARSSFQLAGAFVSRLTKIKRPLSRA